MVRRALERELYQTCLLKIQDSHISTGDIFRNEIKSGNSELIQYVERHLVPDSVVNKVVEKHLSRTFTRTDLYLTAIQGQ